MTFFKWLSLYLSRFTVRSTCISYQLTHNTSMDCDKSYEKWCAPKLFERRNSPPGGERWRPNLLKLSPLKGVIPRLIGCRPSMYGVHNPALLKRGRTSPCEHNNFSNSCDVIQATHVTISNKQLVYPPKNTRNIKQLVYSPKNYF